MSSRAIYDIIENKHILVSESTISVTHAAALMKRHQVGAILIVEHDQLIGIFTERDALFRVLAEGLNPDTTQLMDVMTLHPQTISSNKPLNHALHMMHEGGFRHIPVVENGRLTGIVSARDALGYEMIDFESDLMRRTEIAEILG